MSGLSTEAMVANAQQVWGMLDDMAASNPSAYHAFLHKQRREYLAITAPPVSVFTIRTVNV